MLVLQNKIGIGTQFEINVDSALWTGETGNTGTYIYKAAGAGTQYAYANQPLATPASGDYFLDIPYYIWSSGTSYYGFMLVGPVLIEHHRDNASSREIRVYYNNQWNIFNMTVKGYSSFKVYFKESTQEVYIWRNNVLVVHVTNAAPNMGHVNLNNYLAPNNIQMGLGHVVMHHNVSDSDIINDFGLSLT